MTLRLAVSAQRVKRVCSLRLNPHWERDNGLRECVRVDLFIVSVSIRILFDVCMRFQMADCDADNAREPLWSRMVAKREHSKWRKSIDVEKLERKLINGGNV